VRPVLVTRPRPQAAGLSRLLAERGIPSVDVPTVSIDTHSTAPELDTMLASIDGAAWLIVTSANGAMALAERLAATGRSLPTDVRVAAVGPATARTLRRAGIGVAYVPDTYVTVAIAAGLGDVRNHRVVLARADAATPAVTDLLRARGARVEEVVAYRTVEGPAASRDALRRALHGDPSGIAFTSGSTVRGLMRLASPIDRARARSVPAFCIGPVTASVARRLGFHVAGVADEHTAAGLADVVGRHLARVRS